MKSRCERQVNASVYYLDRRIADGDGARPALHSDSESWTYGELLDRVKQCARKLRSVGVKRGDRVILTCPDSPQAVAFLLAAMRVGAAPAPVPTILTDDELSFICRDCTPTAVVVDEARVERVQDLIRQLPAVPEIILP
ncbi:MAG TPA: class I adenylate-forming enzyme family protein, partial [Solirubrobacteraceae bacterium]